MMITGYEAFCLYQAIKLHFTTDYYDYFKYGGKSKISVDAFENRKDKFYFYKLSRRLQSKDDLVDFLKRKFRYEPLVDRYVAPLDLNVVLEEPCWTKKGTDAIEIAKTNVQTSLLACSFVLLVCLHPNNNFVAL